MTPRPSLPATSGAMVIRIHKDNARKVGKCDSDVGAVVVYEAKIWRSSSFIPLFARSDTLNQTNCNCTSIVMTITKGVTSEMFEQGATNEPQLIRMDQRFSRSSNDYKRKASTIGWWTPEEHERFLEAVELYPSGPWKKIAHHIGSRTPRQVMTHAQKYRQRIKRRGNRKSRAKNKGASSKFSRRNSDRPGVPIIGEEEQKLWELSLQQEAPQLDPQPLLQPIEGEIPRQPNEEVLALDALLLDELQQLIAPTDDAFPEPVDLNGDELMEIVVDTAIDWTLVSSSSCMLLSTSRRRINGSLWFSCLVLALDLCLTDGAEVILPLFHFLLSYPTRFLAFYEPKVMALAALVNDIIERMEISEQVSDAWDFTVALVTLVCVHQVIETTRTSVARRLLSQF
ncbi:Myb domain [Phytophthora cactorum]|nr:Myb domain [Phytophthora cactorum]